MVSMNLHIEQKKKRSHRGAPLFALTFASAFLLAIGLITVGFMVAPVLVNMLSDPEAYKPQLPISEVRIEGEVASETTTEPNSPTRTTQLFPALSQVNDATDGNWIRIPSLGVNVPLVMSPSLNDADVINTLSAGAALYPNGIEPGRPGNAFISAHSTGEPWKGKYRFAFLRINELADGNVIHIDYNGTRYTYEVSRKEIVIPTADFRVISDRPVPTMSLMACWPLWSTEKRMLVHSELTNITKLTEKPS